MKPEVLASITRTSGGSEVSSCRPRRRLSVTELLHCLSLEARGVSGGHLLQGATQPAPRSTASQPGLAAPHQATTSEAENPLGPNPGFERWLWTPECGLQGPFEEQRQFKAEADSNETSSKCGFFFSPNAVQRLLRRPGTAGMQTHGALASARGHGSESSQEATHVSEDALKLGAPARPQGASGSHTEDHALLPPAPPGSPRLG